MYDRSVEHRSVEDTHDERDNQYEEDNQLKNRNSPSHEIETRIKEMNEWRGEMLARIRMLIQQADPDVVEEVKWRKPSNSMAGVPVWSHAGIICTGETYKSVVKMTFAKGASLPDTSGLFNSSLEGNTRRAIDVHEGDKVNEKALNGAGLIIVRHRR